MTEAQKSGSSSGWICNQCGVPLEMQKVRLQYLRTIFAFDLPTCHRCGAILVAEELAVGMMAEAEEALEDK